MNQFLYFARFKYVKTVKPNQASTASKKVQVEQMFDDIASKYDFLNHFLSLGIDKGWRVKAVQSIADIKPTFILDVATGTADLAIASLKLNPEKIVGIDISNNMLEVGREKIRKAQYKQIELIKGDSENLPFADNTFDAITVAFGVRNFEHLEKGLGEMLRVLKPGGKIAILEFSKPTLFPFKQIYQIYFNYILPTWGKWISKSNNAYAYLPESVKHFPDGKNFLSLLNKAGYVGEKQESLTFGICSLYNATKS